MPNQPFPSYEAHFDQSGSFLGADSTLDIAALTKATDLFVMSHGWNNDENQARSLYDGFFASVGSLIDDKTLTIPQGRDFRCLRIFWPSKQFDLPNSNAAVAAGAGDPALAAAVLQTQRLIDATADPSAKAALTTALGLLGTINTDASAADQFVRLVLSTATSDAEEHDPVSSVFEQSAQMRGGDMLDALGRVPTPPPTIDTVAADAGQENVAAFGITNLLGGAVNFLNLFTYKTMKERAGIVGTVGVAPLLAKIRAQCPTLRIHLVGHSFGGRLVTSVANAFPGNDWGHRVSSMLLLQAAFSQFGFAKNYLATGKDGAFRGTLLRDCVVGEIAITHTTNDKANGSAYPLASRLFNQVASAVGDATDLYGAIGCNGAQDTPEAVQDVLGEAGNAYAALPAASAIRNLRADKYISSHGDVEGRQVAYVALRNALASA